MCRERRPSPDARPGHPPAHTRTAIGYTITREAISRRVVARPLNRLIDNGLRACVTDHAASFSDRADRPHVWSARACVESRSCAMNDHGSWGGEISRTNSGRCWSRCYRKGRGRGGRPSGPGGQKPMSIVVTAGQRGDSPQFQPVLEKVRVPRIGPGRPRVRPDRVRADKAYASRKNRTYLRNAASAAPSRTEPTRPSTGRSAARAAAVRRSSTRSTISTGTRSSTASIASGAIGPWPRGTTSWRSATRHAGRGHQRVAVTARSHRPFVNPLPRSRWPAKFSQLPEVVRDRRCRRGGVEHMRRSAQVLSPRTDLCHFPTTETPCRLASPR